MTKILFIKLASHHYQSIKVNKKPLKFGLNLNNSLILQKIYNMTEKEVERREKVKTILKDINSGESKKIIKGLRTLKVNGDDQVIVPIVEVWNNGVSSEVEGAIITFLGDIKSSTSSQIIMDILLDKKYSAIHLPLLTTIWNSKVDYSEYLVEFVSLSIQYDFMIALECLTIIENMKGPFEEHHILDAEIILREYAEKQQHKSTDDDKKVQFIHEINMFVSALN